MDDLLESHVTGYGTPLSTDDVLEDDIVDILRGELVEIQAMNDDLQARAEAAETDLRELRENTLLALGLNPIDVTDGTEDATIAYLLSGLRERVQELEAQLAAMDDDEREDVRHRAIINDVFGDDAKWGCDE